MELSVVIPVYNEAANILPLIDEITAALDGQLSYEIMVVDDGSQDATVDRLRQCQQPQLRILQHATRAGQSAALWSGVQAAHGEWVATLDGDGQNDPADIPRLLEQRHAGYALIAGWRQRRHDSWIKRASSRIANAVRRGLLHDNTPDSACGLKLINRAVFLQLPYFDHMHRFLPALVLRAGGRVCSVPVNHRPRRTGSSHYGVWDRLWIGIVDLFGVSWLQRRMTVTKTTELTVKPVDED